MSQIYLTSEGLEKMTEELNNLKTTRRREIAERIQNAKELGDLSENAEYADAKNEQAFNEGKIMELENKIKNAIIFKEGQKSKGVVTVGSIVRVKSNKREAEYTIVGSEDANPQQGRISNLSPMGSAFLGKKIGEVVNVQCPSGICEYRILEVK